MRPRLPDPENRCKYCGKLMERRRYSGRLEGRSNFAKRVYCDRMCMAQGMVRGEGGRNMYALAARKQMAATCEMCGAAERLQVHHENGDYRDNTPGNVGTLCASCHMKWHWENGKETPTKRINFDCIVCGRPAEKRMMCEKHYQRQKKHGSPHLTMRQFGEPDRRGRRAWILVEVDD